MKCIVISYSAFCNTNELDNDMDFIKKLFNNYIDKGFIVNQIKHQNIKINDNGSKVISSNRPQLINNEENEIINIMPERIDYFKILSNDDSLKIKEGLKIEKTYNRINILGEILDLIGKKASRLALNIDYDGNDKAIELKINNNYYNNDKFNEFTSTIVNSETYEKEKYNISTQISCLKTLQEIQVANQKIKIKGYHIHNDINTNQLNSNVRFDKDNIYKIFMFMIDKNNELLRGYDSVDE